MPSITQSETRLARVVLAVLSMQATDNASIRLQYLVEKAAATDGPLDSLPRFRQGVAVDAAARVRAARQAAEPSERVRQPDAGVLPPKRGKKKRKKEKRTG